MRHISILGATGSIGRSTLDVVSRHPERFKVEALSANTNVEELFRLCAVHMPLVACLADEDSAIALAARLKSQGLRTTVLSGQTGLVACATLPEVDCVMAAIVGAAGLQSTIAACRAGKTVLLANKEALVMSGAVLIDAVRINGATLLPIDSEHNAIFQCMNPGAREGIISKGVRRILLTASGGPFRTRSRATLSNVTPEEACAHPKWVMGRKISVDSATMMNKGLEVIEAHWLFGARKDQIEVVIHPQSVVHSMVEYVDGSVLAQMGNPDMRTPIAHALAYPDRIESGVTPLSLPEIGELSFQRPDFTQFPAVRLAYEALATSGTAPILLNGANEVAVAAFLDGELSFLGITDVIEATLNGLPTESIAGLEHVLETDLKAREYASRMVGKLLRRAVWAS